MSPQRGSSGSAQSEEEDSHAEQLMFDKAELAARITRLQTKRDELVAEIAALDDADPQTREREIGWRNRQVAHLQDIIDALDGG